MTNPIPPERLARYRKSTLTRLTRLAERRSEAAPILDLALDESLLDQLATVAVSVTAESGDAAGAALLRRLEACNSPELLEEVMRRCDEIGRFTPVSLQEVALVATQRIFALRQQEARASNRDEDLLAVAQVGINLSTRLSDSGRWQESLDRSLEALELHRRLGSKENLAADFEEKLGQRFGICLTNHVIRLGRMNRREEALQVAEAAVDFHRRRLDRTPGHEAFGQLASALDNLSITLSELGRSDEGLSASREAMVHRRQAVGEGSDAWMALAASLANLAGRLYDRGDLAEARDAMEESVSIRRELLDEADNRGRPQAELARGLHNLSLVLEALGEDDEALRVLAEAVDIRGKLARVRPDAFGSDLARSAHSLGIRYRKKGELEAADRYLSQAIQLRSPLVHSLRESVASDLADSLAQRAEVRLRLGDVEAALADGYRMLDHRLEAFRHRPQTELPELDTSLHWLLETAERQARWREVIETVNVALEVILESGQPPSDPALDELASWLRRRRSAAVLRASAVQGRAPSNT